MRVYITGIDGMLGSAIARMHRAVGDFVSGCDIEPSSPDTDHIDIRKPVYLLARLRAGQYDRIYHCAAVLGVKNTEDHPALTRQVNEIGTSNVLTAAYKAGVGHFVFLSSSEVYGSQSTPLYEGSPLLGDNVYAKGKIIGEEMVLQHALLMKTTICRMFNCFGPNQVRQFFIPKAIGNVLDGLPVPIFGNPSNTRSYLYADDAAQHICNVADNTSNRAVVNVGSEERHSLGSTVVLIGQAFGHPQQVPDMDVQIDKYEDRAVSRDVPVRIAVLDRLNQFSDHKPRGLYQGLKGVRDNGGLRRDWGYSREVL